MPFRIISSIYEVFEERERARKAKIGFIAGFLIVGWCALVVMVFRMSEKEQQVHVSAPAVVPAHNPVSRSSGIAVPVMRTGSPFRHRITVSTPPVRSSAIHKGGGLSMTVYTTSSASPTSVGGGGSGHYTGNGGAHRTSSPGLNYNIPSLAIATAMSSTSSMVESAQERLTRHSLTAENTLNSMQEVIEQNSPNAAPARSKKGDWDDYGQDEEPFLDSPVGDVAWGVMILLAAVYGGLIFLKKRNRFIALGRLR